MTLQELEEKAAECTLCELHKGRINPVFAKGSPAAKLMICGMVPAFDENKEGIPFVGRAGKLLDRLLTKTRLSYDDVYITNLVKCFLAPGKPLEEPWVNSCLPYLISQIGIIKPHVIITLGADASRALLGEPSNVSIGKLRGQAYDYGIRIKIVPTYHPSYLLRKGGEYSADFGKVTDDFLMAREIHSEYMREVMESSTFIFHSSE